MSLLVDPLTEPNIGFCRAMLRSDFSDVLEIEQNAYQFPWAKAIFVDCIRAGYHCNVLQTSHGIGGYSVLTTAAGEGHVLNLCVRRKWQGRGLAKILLHHLLDTARAQKAATLFLEVRPSNKPALRLYENAGFCELGVRPGYYPADNGREDAILMACTL